MHRSQQTIRVVLVILSWYVQGQLAQMRLEISKITYNIGTVQCDSINQYRCIHSASAGQQRCTCMCYAGESAESIFHHGNHVSMTCTACVQGKYQYHKEYDKLCTLCDAGEGSAARHSSWICYPCPVGSYSNENRICQKCQAGYSTDSESSKSLSDCVKCAAGKYESNRICVDCGAGTSSSEPGQTGCTSCERGKYQETPGKDSCFECSDRKTTLHTGAISENKCTKCPVGYYIAPDKHCQECPHAYHASTLTNASSHKTMHVQCIQIVW